VFPGGAIPQILFPLVSVVQVHETPFGSILHFPFFPGAFFCEYNGSIFRHLDNASKYVTFPEVAREVCLEDGAFPIVKAPDVPLIPA